MRNYEVKTPVRGLPRADKLREPVGEGSVIALPFDRALELEAINAVEETDAAVTVPLDWPETASGYVDGGAGNLLHPPIAVVAVTDRHALVDAIVDLGGIVFFVGEGLPDDAIEVLADFSNDQLLAELDARRAEGRLPSLAAVVREEGELEAPYNEAGGTISAPIAERDPAPVESAPAAESGEAPAEAKPARKKAPVK